MSIATLIDVKALAHRFADAIACFNAPIAEIWIREHRGDIQLWIIVDDVDLDRERRVYEAAAQVQDAFPDRYLDIQGFSPMNFPKGYDLHKMIPADTERIELVRAS